LVTNARRKPNFTPLWVIIALNVLLFFLTAGSPRLSVLLALTPARVIPRPWTLVTCMFLHGGLMHLAANMITLSFFGRFVIALVGAKKFLRVYFIGGVAGSVLYVLLADPNSWVVGASGAVFALGGVLTVMRPGIKVFVIPIPFAIPLWIAVIGGFAVLSFIPNVAWQGHLGGLLAGLAFGSIYRKRERELLQSLLAMGSENPSSMHDD
jgi:membrane associated rhomboid family serine protease